VFPACARLASAFNLRADFTGRGWEIKVALLTDGRFFPAPPAACASATSRRESFNRRSSGAGARRRPDQDRCWARAAWILLIDEQGICRATSSHGGAAAGSGICWALRQYARLVGQAPGAPSRMTARRWPWFELVGAGYHVSFSRNMRPAAVFI